VPIHQSDRLSRCARLFAHFAMVSLVVMLVSCGEPRDASYYLAHSDERAAKLQSCRQTFNPSNDAQCRAAAYADNQAIEAEHGPPFHGHDIAWYKSHYLQQAQEAAYCDSLRDRSTDPDCVAAAKGEGVRF
jgi:hypothetical protein